MSISALAVIDWGLGGFSFVKELQRNRVQVPILYFSDAGFFPYGRCSEATLKERLQMIFAWCFTQGCSNIVVACNAASSVLLPKGEIERSFGYSHHKIISIIHPTIEHLSTQDISSLHIIGGNRTILSRVYEKNGLPKHTGTSAQPLSAYIERGVIEGAEIEHTLSKVLNREARHLLLACTHYEILSYQQLKRHMPYLERVWYPSSCLYTYMRQHFLFKNNEQNLRCYTTADPQDMHIRAMKVFGVASVPPFQEVALC